MFPNQSSSAIADLEAAYSDSQAEGSPYDTGSSEIKWPKYKKVASMFGDIGFQAPRRQFLNAAYDRQDCWAFHFVGPSSTTTEALGVGHGSDLQVAFAKISSPSSEETALMHAMNDYWLNFAATLNPNGDTVDTWNKWTYSGRKMMQFGLGSDTKEVKDDFRTSQTGKIASKAASVRLSCAVAAAAGAFVLDGWQTLTLTWLCSIRSGASERAGASYKFDSVCAYIISTPDLQYWFLSFWRFRLL